VLFVLVFLAGGNIAAIFVLNMVISTVTTFFAPAEAAMIPMLVPRSQLMAANGIFTLTLNAAFALGFALLGPLVVNVAGPDALILLVAVLYLVAMVFTITLPAAPPSESRLAAADAVRHTEKAVSSTFGQLREGLAYIRANRGITWSLVYLGITASLIGVLGVLGPAFATDALGLDPKQFVVVVLPLGFGVVTGILAVNSLGHQVSRRRMMEGGLVALGVLLVLLSIAGPISRALLRAQAAGPLDLSSVVSLLSVVVAIAFCAGIAYACVAIPAQTGLQEDLPEEVRGRVFGVLNMLVSIASFVPIIVVGPISDVVGATVVIVFVGLAVAFTGLVSIVTRGAPTPAVTGQGG
jgi:MFS family permease